LERKFNTARNLVPAPTVTKQEGATYGIISLGSNEPAMVETLDRLAGQGVACDYMRIKALPINNDVHTFVSSYDKVFVVENNFDGQLHQILQLELPEFATKMVSISRCNGLPLDADWLVEAINESK
ncbi:MAG TPA: 2-oxoacid:acceptor oxidoreductase subunit alpha, partial [Myxococcales bacterium]|nr:2-oxoacid:acceptor oxidoreductase subunit alpha [Myxococcales bacterium]